MTVWFTVQLTDAPGSLARVATALGERGVNITGIVERLLADASLIRLPLVRLGNEVTAGPAEATWKSWLSRSAVG